MESYAPQNALKISKLQSLYTISYTVFTSCVYFLLLSPIIGGHFPTGIKGSLCVGISNVGGLEVEDNDLEMNARTQCSLQAGKQYRVMVKVFPKVRAWLLGMDQPNLLALLD